MKLSVPSTAFGIMKRYPPIYLLAAAVASACAAASAEPPEKPTTSQGAQDTVPYPQNATPRVAYIQGVQLGYELRVLDAATGQIHDLLHFVNLPDRMSVARNGKVLLIFEGSALHIVDVDGQGDQEISPLPEPVLAKGFSGSEPETAGYLQDGSLAVVMRSDDRTSDMMFHLFQRTAQGWKALETSEACGYYRECPANHGFKHPLDARGLNFTVDDFTPKPIMGKAVEKDPFFVSRSPRKLADDDGVEYENDGGHAIEFDFGASRSTLVYATEPDPDEAGEFITYLALDLPGQKPRVLCNGQCGGEIIGRYLFAGEVIDLSDGKVLLTDGSDYRTRIVAGGWIY